MSTNAVNIAPISYLAVEGAAKAYRLACLDMLANAKRGDVITIPHPTIPGRDEIGIVMYLPDMARGSHAGAILFIRNALGDPDMKLARGIAALYRQTAEPSVSGNVPITSGELSRAAADWHLGT